MLKNLGLTLGLTMKFYSTLEKGFFYENLEFRFRIFLCRANSYLLLEKLTKGNTWYEVKFFAPSHLHSSQIGVIVTCVSSSHKRLKGLLQNVYFLFSSLKFPQSTYFSTSYPQLERVTQWLENCSRKLKVPGSSPATSYVQRCALCSNLPDNV